MNYLVLLNRKFPYKSGEAFLENEIETISSSFDKVFIYPSDVSGKDILTRNIKASNISVYVLEKKSLRLRQVQYLIGGLKYLFEKSNAKSIFQKIINGYFLKAAELQANKIICDLEKKNITAEDKLYIYSYWFYINAKVAEIIKLYFKRKGIYAVAFSRAHRFDIYVEQRKFNFLPQREELLMSLDGIFSVSKNGAEYMVERYPDFTDKIKVSRLGTYDYGFKSVRKRNIFHIVSCSRLVPIKRVELIIEALKHLREADIGIKWTHLGGGELLKQMQEKAQREIPFIEVDFKGSILNVKVYEFYASQEVDVFVNASSSEGLPVSIMEAISFGIPVIATDVGGTREIVIQNESGYLLDVNFKPKDLAENIKLLMNLDDNCYKDLRVKTRKTWENNYQGKMNYSGFVEQILEL